MRNLTDISIWKENLGLLPIHINPLTSTDYVMLNGGQGDFCLQIIHDNEDRDYYSEAWSCNTKNFIVVGSNDLKVFNWARRKREPEIISQRDVLGNFPKFYKYLLLRSPQSERDVVPYVIDIFKQFRNFTLEVKNPVEALNLLFLLLSSLEDDYTSIDYKKWNLEKCNVPTEFNRYVEIFSEGFENIKPKLDLIIRHAAGILFQEAQKEVSFFDTQKDLFGGFSNRIETRDTLYSSIHYTPPYLSRTIVENALKQIDLKKAKLKIFDPACGSSEFLMEVLKQLKDLNYDGVLEVIGWDSSETAITTSKFLLQYEQRTIWQSKLDFKVKLVTDSLLEIWDDDYDLILVNPPYVSWELLGVKDSRDAVKTALGSNFLGKPNQASAFFFKSVKALGLDGVLGCVIPSSLLTLDSYKKLRKDVEELLTINLIAKLGNFVFEDALTDVCIIVGHKPKNNILPYIVWTRNEKNIAQSALRDLRKMQAVDEFSINEKDYNIFQPKEFPIIQDSWKIISSSENDFLKSLERFLYEGRFIKVEDIFNVQQGIRTGNNNYFKISNSEYNQIPDDEKPFFRPVAENGSIKNGKLYIENYIWYPYDSYGPIIKTEEEFSNKVNNFYRQILPYKGQLARRARKDESSWWLLSEHRAWLRTNRPRIVSSEFGRSDSFAFDNKGNFAVERGNAWLPNSNFEKDFRDVNFYYFYLAIFSSPFFDQLLSIYSKQLAGGFWYDLGKKYTGQIPIPKVHKSLDNTDDTNIIHTQSFIFIKLAEYGKQISRGELLFKDELDNFVREYIYPTYAKANKNN